MHQSSYEHMRTFRNSLGESGKILDVGSQDLNGSYKELFKDWEYVGLDIISGKNVDLITSNPYSWEELEDESFDVIISGQTLEHVEFPDKVFAEIYRVLRPAALCCIIAPSSGPRHGEPWYRNFSQEDMKSLAEDVGLKIKDLFTGPDPEFHDCVLIAEKPIVKYKIESRQRSSKN